MFVRGRKKNIFTKICSSENDLKPLIPSCCCAYRLSLLYETTMVILIGCHTNGDPDKKIQTKKYVLKLSSSKIEKKEYVRSLHRYSLKFR